MAAIWSGDTGHIGIHGGVDGHTIVAVTKTNFLAQMSHHIFLPMVLCQCVAAEILALEVF